MSSHKKGLEELTLEEIRNDLVSWQTVAHVSEQLGVTTQTILNMVKSNRIKARSLFGLTVVDVDSIKKDSNNIS